MGPDFKLSDSARRLGLRFNALRGGGLVDSLRGREAYIVVAVLVLVGISLPPISLPSRLFGGIGCTTLTSKSPAFEHPDGLSVTLLPTHPEAKGDRLRLKLDSVPQLELVEGSAASALKKAVQALPTYLAVKSPLYQIEACGAQKGRAALSVAIPNDAEPWSTLDLYTWTGQTWQWLGSQLDLANEVIKAQVDELPANVVVVQTGPVAPVIASDVAQASAGDSLSGVLSVVNEIVLPGLMLSNLGQLQGELAALAMPEQGASYAIMPAVRNWAEGNPHKSNLGLVMDMLSDPGGRSEHAKRLAAVVTGTPYTGLQVDYRGLPANWREAFTGFITELATALHQEDKLLSVVLPPPAPTVEGGWDTGGYDWRAIGAVADAVVLQPTTDLKAYGPNEEAEQVLRWATSQVSRYKLQLAFSALSEEHAANQPGNPAQVAPVSYEDALKLLGTITTTTGSQIQPGKSVVFKLSGEVRDVTYDQDSKLYRLTYAGSDEARTIYLVTASALGDRLKLAARYNLRGVVVYGLLGAADSNDTRLVAALQQYQEETAPAVSDSLQVVWTVRNQAGAQLPGGSSALTNTQYVWTAPATPGRYIVAAAIPGAASRGELPIDVVLATPTPVPPTRTPTPEPTATPDPDAGPCMDASYVADVTVPDGEKFEKSAGFTKTWKVKNTGSCDWKTDVALAFQSGDKLDAPDTVAVSNVKAGQTVDISIPMKSPAQDGNYKGIWRLKDAKGESFGEILTVVIVSGNPAPANVPAVAGGGGAPPPPVVGGGFEIGGHVAGLSRPDLMKQAGMVWIKTQVHHGDDGLWWINTAHSNGFKILFGALGDQGRVMSPGYQDEYAQWVAALAAAGADAIEVWNEPNIDHEWPVGQINGANYTALLAKAYSAIKAANPGTLVVSGALAPTGYFAGGCEANGCNDDVFLGQMAAAGAARYMDCVGAHHNAGATSPSATTGHPADSFGHYSWYFLPTLNLYYGAFGGSRKVCFTEFGYVTDDGYPPLESAAPRFAWAKDVTVGQQAAWLAEAASISGRSGKVRLMIIWNIDFTYYGGDPQAGYAIIRPDGSCPACGALSQVMGSR